MSDDETLLQPPLARELSLSLAHEECTHHAAYVLANTAHCILHSLTHARMLKKSIRASQACHICHELLCWCTTAIKITGYCVIRLN